MHAPGEQVFGAGDWTDVALPLDAVLRIDEGPQFFATASFAARCSVIASTSALATGCT